tara:strand:+ start:138 stop:986 length:849 start_codon:yes stop_codon:yes gene_type:complete
MKKGKKRARTLSLEGLDLFNIGVNAPPITPNAKKVKKTCLRTLIFNLFTTDFDVKLEKSIKTFRKGTCSLYSYLNDDEKEQIPDFFNNAVTNLVYLILVTDDKPNTIVKVKHNINFYLSLADQAFKNGDHNSVILLKAALENIAIRRLKLKKTKKEIALFKKFEESYGTFMTCNGKHLEQMLKYKDDVDKFLPSIVIMLMHLNKTKEYAKCYTSIGKFPKALEDKHNEIQTVAYNYYNNYKDFQDKMLELYLKNPSELKLMENVKGLSISAKLYEISMLVKN